MAEYRFTDEQNQLRDAVRKFSADHFSEEKVRQLMESSPRTTSEMADWLETVGGSR